MYASHSHIIFDEYRTEIEAVLVSSTDTISIPQNAPANCFPPLCLVSNTSQPQLVVSAIVFVLDIELFSLYHIVCPNHCFDWLV